MMLSESNPHIPFKMNFLTTLLLTAPLSGLSKADCYHGNWDGFVLPKNQPESEVTNPSGGFQPFLVICNAQTGGVLCLAAEEFEV
jgi:hypothetical protein